MAPDWQRCSTAQTGKDQISERACTTIQTWSGFTIPATPPNRSLDASQDRGLDRVRSFAKVLDSYGLDPLLGLVAPGVGDILGSVLGIYIIAIAIRRRVSKVVVARMLLNLGIDLLIGVVPLAGDISDLMFKANNRNLKLLESRPTGQRARAIDWLVVTGAVVVFIASVAAVVWVVVGLLRALIAANSGQ